MSILEVCNVSIRYMTGDFKDIELKEYVMRKLKGEYQITEFWADKNTSFTLDKGDMLGIIGTNGAGKSTLVKSGIRYYGAHERPCEAGGEYCSSAGAGQRL